MILRKALKVQSAPVVLIQLLLVLHSTARQCFAQQHRDHLRRAQECASFTPTICAVPDSHIERVHCPTCKFDVERTFYCPLVAGGYYSFTTGGEGGGCLNGAFMAQTHHLPPPCGARCCRTDHQGIFVEDDPIPEDLAESGDDYQDYNDAPPPTQPPGRFEFEPSDSTCRYKEISRGQVMRFLALHNSTLVVAGDSTMRQLFLRMVAMMRGQSRLLDFHIHTHAHYQVCREVDFLRLAANNPTGAASPSDPHFLKDIVPAFFNLEVGPGQADAKRIISECSHPPIDINYLQAPMWMAQAEMLTRYCDDAEASHRRPVVVASVGFWQPGEAVPEVYFQALERLQKSALRVFYVGVPTSTIENESTKEALIARNERMKRWIEGRGAPYSYVDFEALAGASGGPNGTLGSKHYACWLAWKSAKFPVGASGNPAGAGQLSGRVDRIHTDVPGECSDEMNRNLWQVILNGLLDSTGAQAMAGEPPPWGGGR